MAELLHSTVRIECEYSGGEKGSGTGFFYRLCVKKQQCVPVIITNRHVIEKSIKGSFVVTLCDSEGNPVYGKKIRIEFDNFSSCWEPHPDGSTDLAVMPVAPVLQQLDERNENMFWTTLDSSLLVSQAESKNFTGLEAITMVGYPIGLWDAVNNLPICRRGVLATLLTMDWNGNKEFLIDAACFPGSSGSPVFLLDIGGYQTMDEFVQGGIRIKLLGVLYAGPMHTITGDVKIITIPTNQKIVSEATIPIHLGIVIKAEKILEFETFFNK